jgi:hypothetical protein
MMHGPGSVWGVNRCCIFAALFGTARLWHGYIALDDLTDRETPDPPDGGHVRHGARPPPACKQY